MRPKILGKINGINQIKKKMEESEFELIEDVFSYQPHIHIEATQQNDDKVPEIKKE